MKKLISLFLLFAVAQNALAMDPCHYCKKATDKTDFLTFSNVNKLLQRFCCKTCTHNVKGTNEIVISKKALSDAYVECPICYEPFNSNNPIMLWFCCAARTEGGANAPLICQTCYDSVAGKCPICRLSNAPTSVLGKGAFEYLTKIEMPCPVCAVIYHNAGDFIDSVCGNAPCKEANICVSCSKKSIDNNICPSCKNHFSPQTKKVQIGRIQRRDPQFEEKSIRIKKQVDRVLFPVMLITGVSLGTYAIIALCGMLYGSKSLDKLDNSAGIAQKTLLSLDFDLLNPTDKILPLSKQYDVPSILKTIEDRDDNNLRDRLESAIATFDTALETMYTTIASSYYYHPTAYFLEQEAALVAQLESAQANLKTVIEECKKEKAVGYRDYIKCGLAIGCAAACGYYCVKAKQLKKWNLR